MSCLSSKFTKLPYNISKSHAKSIFELVHADIWGPYRVPTRYGHKYFLTIVDDASRATWVYLMKQKSEVANILEEFAAYAYNQFDANFKILRTDNALEFKEGACKKFMRMQGITHQTS